MSNRDDDEPGPLDNLIQFKKPKRGNAPPAAPKKETGQQGRVRRRKEAAEQLERERERQGLNEKLQQQLAQLGAPPLDPLGNQQWANNLAAIFAHALATDVSIPLEQRAKLASEQLDRIAATHSKAVNAKRIGDLQKKVGLRGKDKRNAAGRVPVGASRPLRAGKAPERRGPVRRPVPDLHPEVDGQGTPDGGGAVG